MMFGMKWSWFWSNLDRKSDKDITYWQAMPCFISWINCQLQPSSFISPSNGLASNLFERFRYIRYGIRLTEKGRMLQSISWPSLQSKPCFHHSSCGRTWISYQSCQTYTMERNEEKSKSNFLNPGDPLASRLTTDHQNFKRAKTPRCFPKRNYSFW